MDPNSPPSTLPRLDLTQPHTFQSPRKCINDGEDVFHFLISRAYRDIGIFLLQLNRSMCPRKPSNPGSQEPTMYSGNLPGASYAESITRCQSVLKKLESFLDQAPPDTGPRRFGNVAFRTWITIVEDHVDELLSQCLTPCLLPHPTAKDASTDAGMETGTEPREAEAEDPPQRLQKENEDALHAELRAYFTGSFGSKQRLDYGTGHELSFLAFLGCLWKLGIFKSSDTQDNEHDNTTISRNIVLGIINPYLQLTRKIIKLYTLEPAGSHGVWGLDDHSFIPYILGSAQLSAPISDREPMSVEGSVPGAPATADVVKKSVVKRWQDRNLYFDAIAFINDVKTGPFWEHSPILFDISGVRAGWGKINKGMLKMYNAEVLSKFPVVQHFPFGSLFQWSRDPDAVVGQEQKTVHLAAQPSLSPSQSQSQSSFGTFPVKKGGIGASTAAPWTQTAARVPAGAPSSRATPGWTVGAAAKVIGGHPATTAATWAGAQGQQQSPSCWASSSGVGTTASWAQPPAGIPYSRVPQPSHPTRRPHPPVAAAEDDGSGSRNAGAKLPSPVPMTKAPWAK